MRCHGWTLLVVIMAGMMAGCGKTEGTSQDGSAAADPQANLGPDGSSQAAKPKLEGPAGAVYDFLEAVRTGDDATADRMLTVVARKKTQELNMVVAPPGSDTASFTVGEAQMLPDDRAQVACQWADRDADGKMRSDEIIWVLRKEPEGWRVGGMAATVFPGEDPVLLNFEDPEDMLRQQQKIKEEMDRRSAAAQSAQRPEKPGTAEDPIRR